MYQLERKIYGAGDKKNVSFCAFYGTRKLGILAEVVSYPNDKPPRTTWNFFQLSPSYAPPLSSITHDRAAMNQMNWRRRGVTLG